MRHVLLALLIALLPIRGWVGNAMALAMAVQEAPVPAHAGHAGVPAPAVTAVDCLEAGLGVAPNAHWAHHSAPGAGHGAEHPPSHLAPDTAPGESAGHSHTSCDLCNGPAMALDWPAVSTPPQRHDRVADAAVRFASTVLPQGIKPPIS